MEWWDHAPERRMRLTSSGRNCCELHTSNIRSLGYAVPDDSQNLPGARSGMCTDIWVEGVLKLYTPRDLSWTSSYWLSGEVSSTGP